MEEIAEKLMLEAELEVDKKTVWYVPHAIWRLSHIMRSQTNLDFVVSNQ